MIKCFNVYNRSLKCNGNLQNNKTSTLIGSLRGKQNFCGYVNHSSSRLKLTSYTRCIKKKVIELCSALARSLYNLQKSFFRRRKGQAFSFRLLSFLWNLKKDWANTNQMKIAGRNRIFPPLSIIRAANEKRKFH